MAVALIASGAIRGYPGIQFDALSWDVWLLLDSNRVDAQTRL